MDQENEYKSKEPVNEILTDQTSTKKEKKKSVIKNPLKDLSGRFDKKKFKSILGVTMILFSFYFFLACVSYLFTWKEDQDRVLGKTLFSFLFESADNPVENWLGKFGAWSSHLFIYRWFGLSSAGLCVLMFISGVKILFNVVLLPIQKTYAVTILFMVWSSLFLGFFAEKINYLGGTFGFHINHWLTISIGPCGAFLLIGVLL